MLKCSIYQGDVLSLLLLWPGPRQIWQSDVHGYSLILTLLTAVGPLANMMFVYSVTSDLHWFNVVVSAVCQQVSVATTHNSL